MNPNFGPERPTYDSDRWVDVDESVADIPVYGPMNNEKRSDKLRRLIDFFQKKEWLDPKESYDSAEIMDGIQMVNQMLFDIYNSAKTVPTPSRREIHAMLKEKYGKNYASKYHISQKDIDEVINNVDFIDAMKQLEDGYNHLVSQVNMLVSRPVNRIPQEYMPYVPSEYSDELPSQYRTFSGGAEEIPNLTEKLSASGVPRDAPATPLEDIAYSDNLFSNLYNVMNDPDFVDNPVNREYIEGIPLLKAYVNKDYDDVVGYIVKYLKEGPIKESFYWLFFPLYQLEQRYFFGSFFLDILGSVIDLTDIMFKFMVPIFMAALPTFLTLISAIPAVGTVTAPIATAMNIIDKPLQLVLLAIPSFIKMMVCISRKQFGQALTSASQMFPQLGAILNFLSNQMQLINKVLYRTNTVVKTIADERKVLKDLDYLTPGESNNMSVFDFETVFNKFIVPTMQSVPALKQLFNMPYLDNVMRRYQRSKGDHEQSVRAFALQKKDEKERERERAQETKEINPQ
jgi:hypothetical protein